MRPLGLAVATIVATLAFAPTASATCTLFSSCIPASQSYVENSVYALFPVESAVLDPYRPVRVMQAAAAGDANALFAEGNGLLVVLATYESTMVSLTGKYAHALVDSPGGMCLNDEITGPPYLVPCWYRGPDPGALIRPVFP